MALPTSGIISINNIVGEFGGSTPHSISEYYRNGSLVGSNNTNVPTSGQISLTDFYGGTAAVDITSGTTINGQSNRQEITVSSFISSGGTLRIPSGFWIWSDNTSTPAMTIDIPCTILNEGKIIGKGGVGGHGNTTITNSSGSGRGYGADGGIAIKINSGVSNVTITNSSGAFIAGGGGGGGSSGYEPQNTYSGGGGGAGGGNGGEGGGVGTGNLGGSGGILNASGSQYIVPSGVVGIDSYLGGEAGGGGGQSAGEDNRSSGGGGGGRILAGSASPTPNSAHVAGGGAGNAGSDGGAGGNTGKSGGGGGWGADGGDGYNSRLGGSGGKAIEDSGNSYTLNNSGTIYGATT